MSASAGSVYSINSGLESFVIGKYLKLLEGDLSVLTLSQFRSLPQRDLYTKTATPSFTASRTTPTALSQRSFSSFELRQATASWLTHTKSAPIVSAVASSFDSPEETSPGANAAVGCALRGGDDAGGSSGPGPGAVVTTVATTVEASGAPLRTTGPIDAGGSGAVVGRMVRAFL